MIPPQEAVSRAKNYLLELAPGELIEDLRLEEVEFEESKNLWLITLGFFRPRQITNTGEIKHHLKQRSASGFFALRHHEEEEQKKDQWALENRVYKRLAIDAENGDFKSMTIREVH
jgi:hypothetical protein